MIPLLALLSVPQEIVDLPVDDLNVCTEFRETLRVGGDLTTVTSVGFDASGTVRVGDDVRGGVFRVVAVSPDGDRYEYGRMGEGPGEFLAASDLVALQNGHTIVPDFHKRVFHEFLPNGMFRREVPMGDLHTATDMIHRAGRGGVLLGQFRSAEFPIKDTITASTASRTVEGPREVMRILLDEGARPEVFARGWTPPRSSFTTETRMNWTGDEFTMTGSTTRVAFIPRLLWDVLPGGGLAMSDSSAYAINVLDAAGHVVRVLRRKLASRPLTRDFQRAYRALELEELAALKAERRKALTPDQLQYVEELLSEDEDIAEAAIKSMEFADEVPLVDDLLTAWDGTIWVRRTPDGGFPVDGSAVFRLEGELHMRAAWPPAPIDLISPEGTYLGTIPPERWPAALGPGGLVAYIEVDELDVPTVVVGTMATQTCSSETGQAGLGRSG